MAPNMWNVLSESKSIVNSQPHHYLTLSLIFLLPLSFLSLLFQFISKNFQQQLSTNPTTIISLYLLFIILSCIIAFGAVITITYSVFHACFNRPVKLKEALKSIITSFFPLLATATVAFVVFFFIFFLFGLLIGLVLFLITYLGHVDLKTNPNLVALCFMVLFMIVLLPLVTYLLVNLSFMKIIVVVESSWGFEPLRRSWKLVKGMKRLVLSTILLFGFLEVILLKISCYSLVLVLVISPILAILMLYNIVVNTVLYIHCKEKHGEVADVEFGNEKDGANLSLIPV
ncbi:hypothetical protein MtrunA17_Chr4g0042781 [Medicago truncatula]|uniref:Transmembrane protein, putative n=1 Tax=Medicago truncatula TaxID=3880 RepID=A0A072UN60_MEDTR|nr:uncharacterized protein LOC25492975 [Medicago truncatula]KEH30806.1 transmembrane protein, putative [Medicago truncatula]RHN62010.1 hypothetical protein MtrunA17_Chr4g0042781 [Medicago truncatula]